ncbi:MAG: BON domain-containing protein [Pseudomonadota bacterium]|nr:BON domain-containing protein [Pseudomonadota bacterium]
MKHTPFHLSLMAAALALGLAACQKNEEQTVGQQIDAAVAKTEAAAEQAKEKAAEAGQDMQNAAQEAAADVKAAAADATDAVKQAAADAKDATQEAVADAKDAAQRAGEQVREGAAEVKADAQQAAANVAQAADDAGITLAVNAGLAKDAELSALKINVDTKDGAVTLNGEAPTQAAKDRAEAIAKAVNGVKSVDNKLTVQAS